MTSPAVVLIVEDQPFIRLQAMDLVNAAGFEGIEAASADEAIRTIESRPDIRLVFTDIEMPGTMDGLQLAHYVRRLHPNMHLMVASGKVIARENQLPPNSKFFPKPYDDDTIIDEMKRLLSTPTANDQDGGSE